MLRAIWAVIAGYVVMALVVMIGFMPAIIQPEYAWTAKNTMDLNANFVAMTVVASIIGSLAGGWVCASIARCYRPVFILGGVIAVLGLASAITNQSRPPLQAEPEKIAAMTSWEKGTLGREPTWYAFSIPLVGLTGVLLCGCWSMRSRAAR